MKQTLAYLFVVLLATAILIGCSTTRRLTDDEVLYTGVKKMEIIILALCNVLHHVQSIDLRCRI